MELYRWINSLKGNFFSAYARLKQKKVRKKILVFESDDWGSIRIQSKQQQAALINEGFELERSAYDMFDGLEKSDDLDLLFNLLDSFKVYDCSPVFTCNIVMANPDFDAIKKSHFQEYVFEPFDKSYEKYYREVNTGKWNQAIENALTKPQFHCREHVNVAVWMRDLRDRRAETVKAFENDFFALKTITSSFREKSYLAAYNHETDLDERIVINALNEGLDMFEKRFKFPSKSFIAANYTWGNSVEKQLHEKGVKYIQGQRVQKVPVNLPVKYILKRNFTGRRNEEEQIYLVRNCIFEPFTDPSVDWVDNCLADINRSFYWGLPAIVCTHRANYTSALSVKNRDHNLKELDRLISDIIKKWPDVTFMTSDKLGEMLEGNE